MYSKIFLFLSIIKISNSFIIVNPIISKLESIVTTKAIYTSFLTNLRSEFTLDRVFAEISEMHYSVDYLYFSIFLTYAYGYYKFKQGAESCQIDKFRKIEKFDRVNRLTKELIFIILFIFTKDVQNAI